MLPTSLSQCSVVVENVSTKRKMPQKQQHMPIDAVTEGAHQTLALCNELLNQIRARLFVIDHI